MRATRAMTRPRVLSPLFLAQGHHRASDVIGHGVALMGVSSSPCAEPPVSRPVSFQTIDALIRSFCSSQVRALWEAELAGPWHSRWVRHTQWRRVKLEPLIDDPPPPARQVLPVRIG